MIAPISRAVAKDLVRESFESGVLAFSPDGVKPHEWCALGREVGKELHVFVQYQEAHNGQHTIGILRANRGFPARMDPHSVEAKIFHDNHPEWREEMRTWNLLLAHNFC